MINIRNHVGMLNNSNYLKTGTRNRAGVRDPRANSGHQRDRRSIVVTEAKLNNIVYFVYTWTAVCTVQLIHTWSQFGLSIVFVDYSENEGHTDTQTDKQGFL